ncbi:MAG TPA: FMN reductase [Vitreimonas sp.]|nr:FMN reductase [Vitreimonas sp.]
MTRRSLVVVSAGIRQPSATRLLAERLSAATTEHLGELGVEPAASVVELREHAQDLTNNLLTGFPSPRLRTAVDSVLSTDGLIAVTPIFNASYSGLFKLFFDVIEKDALGGKPVLIAATGGTARHSLALEHAVRPLFAYLNAAVVPTAVYAASEDWGDGGNGVDGGLVDRIDRAAGELARAIAAGSTDRPVDPFEHPADFEELLGGLRAGTERL